MGDLLENSLVHIYILLFFLYNILLISGDIPDETIQLSMVCDASVG